MSKTPLVSGGIQTPAWAEDMARKYAASALSTFILHGNVLDLVAYAEAGKYNFKPLVDFLTDVFFAQRKLVLTYDLSNGIQAPTAEMRGEILRAVKAIDTVRGTKYADEGLPKDPLKAVELMGRLIRGRLATARPDDKRIAMIIKYADTVFTEAESGLGTVADRAVAIALSELASDPDVLANDVTIVLIAESLSLMSRRVKSLPYGAQITLDLPGEDIREAYLLKFQSDYEAELAANSELARQLTEEESTVAALKKTLSTVQGNAASVTDELKRREAKLATLRQDEASSKARIQKLESIAQALQPEVVQAVKKHTSGLTLVQIRALLQEAQLGNVDFGHPDYIYRRKREMIEAECRGLLEFITPKYKLDMVAVHNRAVEELKRDAQLVIKGHLDAVPMGYLVTGPSGSGKSFLIKAFAGEVGIPCVELKNFREKWVGATEQNLEKIINLLAGLAPVACIIDEADAYLGDREGGGDSGVSSRVFSRLTSFMGDTANRGKILWFLITNRPDLLAIDMKRQGRAEKHLPLFLPDTEKDYEDLYSVLARKLELDVAFKHLFGDPPDGAGLKLSDVHQHSGADLEALLVRAKGLALIDGRDQLGVDDFVHCLADYMSPVYPQQVEYQLLQAVAESTSRALIPEKWRIPAEELAKRIERLRPYV